MVVPGYILNELILESQEKDFSIYQAIKQGEAEKYLIKIIKEKEHLNGFGSGHEKSIVERETLGKGHQLSYLSSFPCEGGVCCVYEDEPIQSLKSLGELSPQQFLQIAESLAQILSEFHSQQISLPSLSRDSFLFNNRTNRIRIAHLEVYKPSSSPTDLEGDLKRLGQIYLELVAPSKTNEGCCGEKDPLFRLNSAPTLKEVLSNLLRPTPFFVSVRSLLNELRRIEEDGEICETSNLEFDSLWLTNSMSTLQRENFTEESVAQTAVSLVLRNGIKRACLLFPSKTSQSFEIVADSQGNEKKTLHKVIEHIAQEALNSSKVKMSSDFVCSSISSENGDFLHETEGVGYPFLGRERKGVLYLEGPQTALHTVSVSPLFAAFVNFLAILLDNAALASKVEPSPKTLVESAVDVPDTPSIWGKFYSNLSKRLDSLVIPSITPSNESQFNVLVESLEQWEFDIFEFDRLCEGRSLYYMSCVLFKKHNLVKHFNIDEKKLRNFMQFIDDGYRENPYHNSLHAADVAQTIHYFLTTGGLSTHLTEADILSMLVAAIIHDYKHPGLTNKFLIDTVDPVSIIYNDVSVLENFHLAESFAYMLNDDTNILLGMPPQQKQEIRKSIIQTVLSTDLANHVSILSQFNEKSAQGGVSADRQLLLKIFIKSADISHPVKPNSLHKEWSSRLIEEFYLQGEKESKLGLPVSAFMDRNKPAVSTCQLGFIHFFVEPLFKATYSILSPQAQETLSRFLNENLKYWKDVQSTEDQLLKENNKH